MIRRCFLAALLFCAVSCPMMAQGGKVNVLYLDGTAHEVQMSQVAKLTVADGNVKLLSKSGATVATHAVKNMDKIELKGSTAGMVQLTKQSPITLRSNGYTITAEGMTDGKLLEVYAANGSLAAQATARCGKAKIDATQLAAGVYVVKAEGQSLRSPSSTQATPTRRLPSTVQILSLSAATLSSRSPTARLMSTSRCSASRSTRVR